MSAVGFRDHKASWPHHHNNKSLVCRVKPEPVTQTFPFLCSVGLLREQKQHACFSLWWFYDGLFHTFAQATWWHSFTPGPAVNLPNILQHLLWWALGTGVQAPLIGPITPQSWLQSKLRSSVMVISVDPQSVYPQSCLEMTESEAPSSSSVLVLVLLGVAFSDKSSVGPPKCILNTGPVSKHTSGSYCSFLMPQIRLPSVPNLKPPQYFAVTFGWT